MQPQTTEAPGYKTSEFWLTVALVVLTALTSALSQLLPHQPAATPPPDGVQALATQQLGFLPVALPLALPAVLSWIATAIAVGRYIQGRTVLKQQGILSWPQHHAALASRSDPVRPSGGSPGRLKCWQGPPPEPPT